jgi:hypothetical protein
MLVHCFHVQPLEFPDDLLLSFPLRKMPNEQDNSDDDETECNCRGETLLVSWRVGLLPDNELQPRPLHVLYGIDRSDDKSPFFIVIGTDFIRPS